MVTIHTVTQGEGVEGERAGRTLGSAPEYFDVKRTETLLGVKRLLAEDTSITKQDALDVIRRFCLLHQENEELSREEKQRSLRNAFRILISGSNIGGDIPKDAMTVVIASIEFLSEYVTLEEQKYWLEQLILQTTNSKRESVANLLGGNFSELARHFGASDPFLRAIKFFVVQHGNKSYIEKLTGMTPTYDYGTIEGSHAISIDESISKVDHCSDAEITHGHALEGVDECILIAVQGKVVGLLKTEGEPSMLALRDVTDDQGVLVLQQGHIYAMEEGIRDDARHAFFDNDNRTTMWDVHSLRVKHLRVLECDTEKVATFLRENSQPEDAQIESRVQRRPSIQEFLDHEADPLRNWYRNHGQNAVYNYRKSVSNALERSREKHSRSERLKHLRVSQERERNILVELEKKAAGRGLAETVIQRIRGIFREGKDERDIRIIRGNAPLYDKEIADWEVLVRDSELVDTRVDTRSLDEAGLSLVTLSTKATEKEERERKSTAFCNVVWNDRKASVNICYSSSMEPEGNENPDSVILLEFDREQSKWKEFLTYLNEANPLIPFGQFFEKEDMKGMTIEFPCVVRENTLVPTPRFCKKFGYS